MYQELIQQIDSLEIISFDIFDTLIFRKISRPVDIFRTMDNEIHQKYGVDNFSKLRIQAEIDARKQAQKKGRIEVTLSEIYKVLDETIAKTQKKANFHLKKVQALEISREIEFVAKNPLMYKVFNYCLKKRKQVFLISDMYLDRVTILRLLRSAGYKIPQSVAFYLSSEHQVSKGDGGLFRLVQHQHHLDTQYWLHIGDNSVSDVSTPQSLGLKAFHYPNINQREPNPSTTVFESIIWGTRNIHLYHGDHLSYWDDFGIRYLTQLYLGFTNWLYLLNRNHDNLFFMARDTYIIKKIYELFPQPRKQHLSYLYVSRQAVQVPALYRFTPDTFVATVAKLDNHTLTLGDIFKRCSLPQDYHFLPNLRLYNFQDYSDVITPDNHHDAVKCACSILMDYDCNLQKSASLAEAYLRQEITEDVPYLIDVGWGGSIQESISKTLKRETYGYYFGTIQSGKENYITHSFGYAFDLDEADTNKNYLYRHNKILELVFSAPHGTTTGYRRQSDGHIEPIIAEYEENSPIIDQFQTSSLNVIKDIMLLYRYYDNLGKDFCLNLFQDFLERKNYSDLQEFTRLNNDYHIVDSNRTPYVPTLKKEDLKTKSSLNKPENQGLWPGAFVIEGVDNDKDFRNFIKNLDLRSAPPSRRLVRRIIPESLRQHILIKRHNNKG